MPSGHCVMYPVRNWDRDHRQDSGGLYIPERGNTSEERRNHTGTQRGFESRGGGRTGSGYSRRGKKELSDTFSDNRYKCLEHLIMEGVLVAGDSNVYRLRDSSNTRSGSGNVNISFLAVSGARYVKDRKNFRCRVREEVEHQHFRSIYLHLGSNDVFCTIEDFYRNASEVVDVLRETAPGAEIVLCSILPRAPDFSGRGFLSLKMLRACQHWVMRANQALQDVALHIPYVRFWPRMDCILTECIVIDITYRFHLTLSTHCLDGWQSGKLVINQLQLNCILLYIGDLWYQYSNSGVCIFLGDFNAKYVSDNVSSRDNLLRRFLNDCNMLPVNCLPLCTGSPYSYVSYDDKYHTLIDFICVPSELYDCVRKCDTFDDSCLNVYRHLPVFVRLYVPPIVFQNSECSLTNERPNWQKG
ncbi:hypothetical protein MAR_016819 [Mya arenaria]|uniref:Endonuclease/exonuclease/phosphatase domain-containing protein n=1 Tax=Mya arenaria TaxID=6604 RepID=A0ABY7EDA9_MYAAR|nr:hypothetical protein MAR_016819 [Mya arenaria]